MQFKNALLAASAMAGVALAQTNSFSVATPQTLVQCQPYAIQITGGSPPFNIRVTEAGNTSNVIETLAQTSSRSVTWTVNIRAGTTLTLYVVDSTGAGAASAISNAIGNGDSSCLNSSASVSTGAAGSGGSGSTSAASGGSSTSSAAAGGSTTSAAGSASRTSSSAAPANTSSSSSSGSNGAGQLSGYSAAVAGAVGVVVAALF